MKYSEQIACNICGGHFYIDRGYKLEKKCISCRELKLQKNKPSKLILNDMPFLQFDDKIHELNIDEFTIDESYFVETEYNENMKELLNILVREARLNFGLTEKEENIIYLYYLEGKTHTEIGKICSCSKTRTGQILSATQRKLQRSRDKISSEDKNKELIEILKKG